MLKHFDMVHVELILIMYVFHMAENYSTTSLILTVMPNFSNL